MITESLTLSEVPTASSVSNRLSREGADREEIYDALVAEFRGLVTSNVGTDALIAWLTPMFRWSARNSGGRSKNAVLEQKQEEEKDKQITRIDDGKVIKGPYAHFFNPTVMDQRHHINGRLVFFKHMTRADFLNKIDEIDKAIDGHHALRRSYSEPLAILDKLQSDTFEEAALKVKVSQKAA
jgi:hypothetical protein|tara:strand:- start:353 stop:898 length:546 start_codon:yes stop_codon:yes gene_type:complete